MVAESWFRSLWKPAKKQDGGNKALIGVLAFEVASLMSKQVHLWQSLGDKHVEKLREEMMNSTGVKKLVSEDDDYIVRLICAELMENLTHVAKAVARLSKKCSDPLLKSFEQAFNDLANVSIDSYGWLFSFKKMDRKVRKMERFILINANLYQEMESLGDLEQALKRMKSNDDADSISLVEYEKKIAWKLQEVKHLKQISVWSRSYDYTVLLLARSLFTIYSRIGHVFGIGNVVETGAKQSKPLASEHIHRSRSVVFMQSSVHPAENNIYRFASGPLNRVTANSGPMLKTNNGSISGSLRDYIGMSSSVPEKQKPIISYSAPLGRSKETTGPLEKVNKAGLRLWQFVNQPSRALGKSPNAKQNRLITKGALNEYMMGGNSSAVNNGHLNSSLDGNIANNVAQLANNNFFHGNISILSSKHKLLNAPPETLGAAALSLHYANIIIVIEKLVASPHLIGHDARDDLYNMLPASIRAALRAKLKPYAKSLMSSIYDTVLAAEWNEAMSGILEWLAPLAHNTIRWQTERSFEHQNLVSRTNVLLVQTLYFANQEKTEATIAELLVGLNYIWRFGRELNAKALMECNSSRTFDDYLDD
ncbi:OLC1v1019697C1 [Oldenlandia corymbosa var. corymbosa]|uniref:OLC1v1019697C1 n=1 Tax=Oldenlandia corymbosa var. corymbosa TaxID=529605 RepID=A0AAV1EET4_OLDCO|nr:OLC1v1019697C1 [Oldenlandia corymbosa var. corymbosa]